MIVKYIDLVYPFDAVFDLRLHWREIIGMHSTGRLSTFTVIRGETDINFDGINNEVEQEAGLNASFFCMFQQM